MTVRLYQSSDVGAPELSSTSAGSLITILRACLVDGYGTRTAAGWTMPFSDLPNNLACFKSVTSDTIRVDDNDDYRWCSVLGFKTMSDVNTGTEQYPSPDDISGGYEYRISKRYNSSEDTSAWLVIASDDWFYFVGHQQVTLNNYPSGFFFGKYDCVNPSFTENNMITGYRILATSTTTTKTYQGLFEDKPWYARRTYQNGLLPTTLHNEFDNHNWANPNPFTGNLSMSKVYLRTTNTPSVRYGGLPNHFRLVGSTNLGYRGGELFEVSGVKYIIIAYISSSFAIQYDSDVG